MFIVRRIRRCEAVEFDLLVENPFASSMGKGASTFLSRLNHRCNTEIGS